MTVSLAGGVAACGDATTPTDKIKVSPETRRALRAGETRTVIVGLRDELVSDPDEIIDEAQQNEVLALRASLYADLGESVSLALPAGASVARRFDHLPFLVADLGSESSLDQLALLDEVEQIVDDQPHALADATPASLDALVASLSARPSQATVAVLDSGVDHRLPGFGSCVQAADDGCKVVYAADLAADDDALDADGRGTELATAILGRLPGVSVAALDVVGDDGLARTSDVLAGIEWAIAHRQDHHVAAIALTLADDRLDGTGRDVLDRSLGLAGHGGVGSAVAARLQRHLGDYSQGIRVATPVPHAAPTAGSVVIGAGNPVYTTTTVVQLTISAVGATQMCVSNTTTCSTWAAYATTRSWTLSGTNGTKTVRVWFRNAALETTTTPALDSIILDRVVPTNGSLGMVATFDTAPGPASIQFIWLATICGTPTNIQFTIDGTTVLDVLGDSNSCTCAPGIRTATVTDPAALALIGSSNTYGVQFTGPSSEYLAWAVASHSGVDVVIFDAAPAGSAEARSPDLCGSGYLDNITTSVAASNPPLTDYNGLDLSWNGFLDNTSGIAGYRLDYSDSVSPANCTGPSSIALPATTQTYSIGGLVEGSTVNVRLCAVDGAGNVSLGILLSRTLGAPSAPPTFVGSPFGTAIHINNNAEVTASATVQLRLFAREPTFPFSLPASVCISNTATCTAWQAYSPVMAHVLASGTGLKTVYVRFRDDQGNSTLTPYVDTITVDTAAPGNGRLSAASSGGSVSLNWSGFTDTGAGIAGYRLVRGTGGAVPASGCGGTDLNGGQNTLTYVDTNVTVGTNYSYRVCAVDNVGLVSTGVSTTKVAAN